MKNKVMPIIVFLTLLAAPMLTVNAQEKEAGAAASLSSSLVDHIIDPRVTRLTAFLEVYNSPLAPEAAHFIAEADKYNLDWKLVAAIAGVESTFGKRIPFRSYNGWGWKVYTGQSYGTAFDSWKEGITEVSRGLRENYMNKGAVTIEQMGHRYAASPRWSNNVRFFIQKIESFQPTKLQHLALAI